MKLVPSLASSQPPATPGRNIVKPIAMMRDTHTIASPTGETSDSRAMRREYHRVVGVGYGDDPVRNFPWHPVNNAVAAAVGSITTR